jgi:hypothetical protein
VSRVKVATAQLSACGNEPKADVDLDLSAETRRKPRHFDHRRTDLFARPTGPNPNGEFVPTPIQSPRRGADQ